MARYNEIMVGRFNRLLQKLLSMKGSAPASQLGSEILPVLPLTYGVELRYLESWDRFANGVITAAAVGFVSAQQLRNPSGSNVIAVVEKLVFGNTSTSTSQGHVSAGAIGTDLASVVSGVNTRMDPRGRPSSTLQYSQQNTTAALGDLTEILAFPWFTGGGPANYDVIATDNQEITVLPGDAIRVVQGTQNIPLPCAIIWRERLMEESERA